MTTRLLLHPIGGLLDLDLAQFFTDDGMLEGSGYTFQELFQISGFKDTAFPKKLGNVFTAGDIARMLPVHDGLNKLLYWMGILGFDPFEVLDLQDGNCMFLESLRGALNTMPGNTKDRADAWSNYQIRCLIFAPCEMETELIPAVRKMVGDPALKRRQFDEDFRVEEFKKVLKVITSFIEHNDDGFAWFFDGDTVW
ncbi:MAG: hypothetical protein ACFFCS_05250 [Candidatus Hodarchaeota archaeon]